MNKLFHTGSLLREFWRFARQNRAWWIVPTVVIMLILAVLVITGQTVAPFIYTLF